MYTFYQEVQRNLGNGERIIYEEQGVNWGMGCNSIHSIYLISFVSGETDFRITSSELDIEILASKRKGFLEFTGALHGISENGSKFSLISYKESNAPRVIKISGNTSRYIISESDGKTIQEHKSNDWKDEEVQIQVPYQSQLTHLAVSKILETGLSFGTTLACVSQRLMGSRKLRNLKVAAIKSLNLGNSCFMKESRYISLLHYSPSFPR